MELPVIDFYGFVAVVIPGTLLLISIQYLFGLEGLDSLLVPDNFGTLGVHLLLAYLIGHLLQGVGNILESVYWKVWGGMPTDWPITRAKWKMFPKAVTTICKFTNETEPSGDLKDKLGKWRYLVAQARTTVYSSGRAKRLDVFNGNYGMYRGVLASVLTIWILALASTAPNKNILLTVLTVITLLTVYRMHRFAMNYAKELFANIAELNRIEKE